MFLEIPAIIKTLVGVCDIFHIVKEDVETVSIYIGSSRQEPYYEYIHSLKPKRVIFNPGTVNAEFMGKLRHAGIEPLSECMLVMLKEDKY